MDRSRWSQEQKQRQRQKPHPVRVGLLYYGGEHTGAQPTPCPRLNLMVLLPRANRAIVLLAIFFAWVAAFGQVAPAGRSTATPGTALLVVLTVVDENGLAVDAAQVSILEPGETTLRTATDHAGQCSWIPRQAGPYSLRVEKPGFYAAMQVADVQSKTLRQVLTHEQEVQERVDVTASTPGIDPAQISDQSTMNLPEIVNVPFPVNHNIRNLLPFNPGVVADFSGQVHVAGGETYMTLDELDGFDIRSPIDGTLDMRVSTDAVRSIDTKSTRYPVEYGRATGGVIAFNTGMGDNKFRYNATDFLPSFKQVNGIHFDQFLPRFTVSGPIVPSRAWFFDGIEAEYDENYVPQLPAGADTDRLIRGSNLIKSQVNLGSANSLSAGLLWNILHSPYDGISAIIPQQSTDNHDVLAWMPYARDQQGFKNGTTLDCGFATMRYREGYEPHGDTPFDLTPELPSGSNFESLISRSLREEGYVDVYLPTRHFDGTHQTKAGIDLDHIGSDEEVGLAPVNYLREVGTLARRSVFPQFSPFARHNVEVGAYVEDRWSTRTGLILEPGLRFDWDEIVRRPLLSPRIAFNYSPPGAGSRTKLSAGIGVYYEHTQLEYLARARAGIRYDTYYEADGTTPTGPAEETVFSENDASLHEAHALNWSAGIEQKLPGQVYLGANYIQKRLSNEFVFANQNGTGAQPGNYLLINGRQDHYYSAEVDARRTFSGGYTMFASYTHSSARTNSALDYVPTVPILGQQQSGPLYWDTPNRIISWGWLPVWAPKLPTVRKTWDFAYAIEWHTGFPFDSIDANEDLVGVAGSRRFPDYLSFSPGLEWRFRLRGKYFGLRGLVENITGSLDPFVVYNNVDSPLYGTFTQPLGRALTARIRLIESSK